jgi:hypothetical protein
MKLMKVWHISPFTEVAGKKRETFHWERECSESKSRVFDLEGIYWMGKSGFAGWIGARNNGGRTSEMRKRTIPLCIVPSISNGNPDKRGFRLYLLGSEVSYQLSEPCPESPVVDTALEIVNLANRPVNSETFLISPCLCSESVDRFSELLSELIS